MSTPAARYSVDHRFAFSLQSDDISRIWSLLSERIGKTTATANCSDHIDRDFHSAKDLLNFDNYPTRRVLGLRIESRAESDRLKSATIGFSDSSWRPVSVSIQASDLVVGRLSQDLDAILRGTRAWYHWFSRVNLIFLAAGLFTALWLLVQLAIAIGWIAPLETAPSPSSKASYLWFQIVVLGLAGALDWFKNRVFPLASFRIGHGTGRYRHLDQIRLAIVLGIPASLLAGLLISMF